MTVWMFVFFFFLFFFKAECLEQSFPFSITAESEVELNLIVVIAGRHVCMPLLNGVI